METNEETEKPAFDLASLDTVGGSDKGARIEIVHPVTKEPLGIFVTVLGKHSQTFRDIIKDRVDSRIRLEASARERGRPVPNKTAEDIEREAIELLVACTVSWDSGKDKPYIMFRGEELSFSVPNAFRVYKEILWIREQVDEGIGDLENFIAA